MTLAPHASGSSSRILSPTSVRLPRVEGAFPRSDRRVAVATVATASHFDSALDHVPGVLPCSTRCASSLGASSAPTSAASSARASRRRRLRRRRGGARCPKRLVRRRGPGGSPTRPGSRLGPRAPRTPSRKRCSARPRGRTRSVRPRPRPPRTVPRSSAASSPGSDGETRDDEAARPPDPDPVAAPRAGPRSRRPGRSRPGPSNRDPSDPRTATHLPVRLAPHHRAASPVVMSKAALEHLSAPKMPVGAGTDGYDGTDPRSTRRCSWSFARARADGAEDARPRAVGGGAPEPCASGAWGATRRRGGGGGGGGARAGRRCARELNKYVANRAAQDVRGFVAKRAMPRRGRAYARGPSPRETTRRARVGRGEPGAMDFLSANPSVGVKRVASPFDVFLKRVRPHLIGNLAYVPHRSHRACGNRGARVLFLPGRRARVVGRR